MKRKRLLKAQKDIDEFLFWIATLQSEVEVLPEGYGKLESIVKFERASKRDPDILENLKWLCFWTVEYARRVRRKRPDLVISKKMIDDYIEVELNIRSEQDYFDPDR